MTEQTWKTRPGELETEIRPIVCPVCREEDCWLGCEPAKRENVARAAALAHWDRTKEWISFKVFMKGELR